MTEEISKMAQGKQIRSTFRKSNREARCSTGREMLRYRVSAALLIAGR